MGNKGVVLDIDKYVILKHKPNMAQHGTVFKLKPDSGWYILEAYNQNENGELVKSLHEFGSFREIISEQLELTYKKELIRELVKTVKEELGGKSIWQVLD